VLVGWRSEPSGRGACQGPLAKVTVPGRQGRLADLPESPIPTCGDLLPLSGLVSPTETFLGKKAVEQSLYAGSDAL